MMLWMACLKRQWNKDDFVDDMPKDSETMMKWIRGLKTQWNKDYVVDEMPKDTVKQRWCCGWHRQCNKNDAVDDMPKDSETKMMLWMTCLKTQWNKDALLWTTSRQPTFDRQVLDEQSLGASDDATIDNSKQLQKQCTQLEKLHVWYCCF